MLCAIQVRNISEIALESLIADITEEDFPFSILLVLLDSTDILLYIEALLSTDQEPSIS